MYVNDCQILVFLNTILKAKLIEDTPIYVILNNICTCNYKEIKKYVLLL